MARRSNRLLFLGTGTSTGVPVIGCDCPVCLSEDPHDRRTRVCALLQTCGDDDENWVSVLLDTSIDLRQQLLDAGRPLVSVAVYTHAHVDHFFGLDELRAVQFKTKKPIEVFAQQPVLDRLKIVYSHLFDPNAQQGGGILSVNLHTAEDRFRAGPLELISLPVWHGDLPVLGYRWGSLAYMTDCNRIPDETWPLLEGIDILVLDALRKRSHPTHFNIDQALEAVSRIAPKRTYFVHMTHDLSHEATNAELPQGVELAYDGLCLDLEPFDPLSWTISG